MSDKSKKIYLDYAATTPVDPAVTAAMAPYFTNHYGNPASLHWAGQAAEQAVSSARKILSQAIGAQPKEIIFTSSATESNNLALKGTAWAAHSPWADKASSDDSAKKIIISAVEHDCVYESAMRLSKQGFQVEILPVDADGKIKLDELKNLIDETVLLVSVIHASNEIGTIQPIAAVGQLCQEHGVTFHVDAAQTLGKINLDVNQMNIDLLTGSAHKIYGPKGIAFLYKKEELELTPLLEGGSQERGYRSSTLNVPGIVGFGHAVTIALQQQKQEKQRVSQLRKKLCTAILESVPNSYLNGHPEQRLYNNLNFRFDFIEGESLLVGLDQHGIAVSTGSACSSPKLEPSRVLLAMGLKPEQAHGSLRITLGRWTTEEEIDQVIEILPTVVAKLRKISPFKA